MRRELAGTTGRKKGRDGTYRASAHSTRSVTNFQKASPLHLPTAENYVFYEPNYDNEKGAANWAVESLNQHLKDKREFTYTRLVAEVLRCAHNSFHW